MAKPNKLLRQFAEAVGRPIIKTGYGSPSLYLFDHEDLQTIIDLTAEWCRGSEKYLTIEYLRLFNCWRVEINHSYTTKDTSLSRAIMTAVVAAAKEQI